MAQLLISQTGRHILQNSMRLLVTRVIRSQDQLRTQLIRTLRHNRTLSLIAITATTYHCYHLRWRRHFTCICCNNIIDCLQHILYCIWCVSIIYHCCPTLGRTNRLKAPVHRLQPTQNTQHLHRIFAQSHCCAIYQQQITHIKPTNQWYKHLRIYCPKRTLYTQQHAIKSLL